MNETLEGLEWVSNHELALGAAAKRYTIATRRLRARISHTGTERTFG